MDTQFGIANVWIQGDFVTRAVAVLCLACPWLPGSSSSSRRWTSCASKIRQAVTTFWHSSDDLADGLNRLGNDPASNPFRQLAIEGREATATTATPKPSCTTAWM